MKFKKERREKNTNKTERIAHDRKFSWHEMNRAQRRRWYIRNGAPVKLHRRCCRPRNIKEFCPWSQIVSYKSRWKNTNHVRFIRARLESHSCVWPLPLLLQFSTSVGVLACGVHVWMVADWGCLRRIAPRSDNAPREGGAWEEAVVEMCFGLYRSRRFNCNSCGGLARGGRPGAGVEVHPW
jgi:hypothetical protein